MLTVMGIATALMPLLLVLALLRLTDRWARRRAAGHARQIALTDAIHRELGAAAAPTVVRRGDGEWQVHMSVPVERPETVARLIGITGRAFAASGERFRMVLTPRPARPRAEAGRAPAATAAVAGRRAPALAGMR